MKKILTPFVFVLLLMACKKDAPVNNTGTASEDVNTWIYNSMNYYYLWNTNMPKISATNLKDNPMKYFYSILYDYGNSDRFSWIDSSASNLAIN